MISLDEAVIARYEIKELTFEIFVDPEKARQYKQGELKNLDEVIASRDIFSDVSSGKRASETDINKIFGTNKFEEIVMKILEKGEIQFTTEQKRKMYEQRRKQLISLIAKGAVDPRTHIPHPASRIENALDEVKFHVDAYKSAESQIEDALKKLKPLIPIKMEKIRLAVKIQAQYAGPVCGHMRNYRLIKEQWGNDGSYMALIELPAGLKSETLDKLNKMTHGEVESKVVETI